MQKGVFSDFYCLPDKLALMGRSPGCRFHQDLSSDGPPPERISPEMQPAIHTSLEGRAVESERLIEGRLTWQLQFWRPLATMAH
jgi:hypothetical protein